MKIKLFCNAGMSTSMLVNKMKKVVEEKGLDIEIIAFPVTAMEEEAKDCDIVLLGPQVKYLLDHAIKICEPKKVPVTTINMQDYGLMQGEKILDAALKIHADYNK